jgi:hypothetical protein
MLLLRVHNLVRLFFALAWLAFATLAAASEYRGTVVFSGLPVPGAAVTATQGATTLSAITDGNGFYLFPDLKDGSWTIEVQKLFFATIKQEVAIAPNTPPATWELKMLPLDQIRAQAILQTPAPAAIAAAPQENNEKPKAQKSATPQAGETPKPQEESDQRASDGLLINGSQNNAASSPFSLSQAFGNTRSGGRGLYNFGAALIYDNSALDARPYSLSGLATPKPAYNQITGVLTAGGPIRIPHLLWHGPNFFAGYQWMRNNNSTALPGLVPTAAEREGDFSGVLNSLGLPVQIFDPATGLPFPGNVGPISPQAQALLNFYPLPNLAGSSGYNYQIPVLNSTHQDAVHTRLDKNIGSKNSIFGQFALQSTRSGNSNLFGFDDRTDALGLNTDINWMHRFGHQLIMTTTYRFSRLRTDVTPFFENRSNVSGTAGINGNDQSPADWGPPGLTFSSGIAGLADAQSSNNRNETNEVSESMNLNHMRHYFTFGGDFRRQEFNYLAQQNPRGAFAFTGAATQALVNGVATGGSDFADFLLGIPDTSTIAYGNADKYFRESVYDAFVTDDFRVRPEFTLNAGVRWEYGAPITELFDRLVNLDVLSDFDAVAAVVATDPLGSLTGQKYPTSLIRPDKSIVEPRIAMSWRPISGSSIVVRSGYGIYSDTSVYQATALLMAQQAPLSKSLSVENSATCPLTLANGFNPCSTTTADTFGVDPNFHVGYAQNWQLSVQSDLPAALQLTATYLGVKGTHGVQQFLPNTYPVGATSPCPACPVGFTYRTSGGNSTRQAGTVQLRRRLRSGFTASLQYTYAKSIDDDAALGGGGPVTAGSTSTSSSQPSAVIAQNWLNLKAERGLSTFDQRHLLNLSAQYTTGMGMHGGTLFNGWRGRFFKEWTVLSNISAGTGLPNTPTYLAAVPGTGVTGTIRPDLTGQSIYANPPGLHLNPAAYATPAPGQWGTAGRNSITGPSQFTLNASLARTFRLEGKTNLDLHIDSTNLLNHGVFTAWDTTINSTQFGLPAAANAMRSLQVTARLRF